MTSSLDDYPNRVGSIRPSQAVHSYGVGSVIDLPHLSVMVSGLDQWKTKRQAVVSEDRLLAAVRARLGAQVKALRALPSEPETNNPLGDWTRVGLPVTLFPRWLRCTRCRRLFPVSSGALKLEHNPHRPDRAQYVHLTCEGKGKPPPAVRARFVAGCANGHLDDFPWVRFAHLNAPGCDNPILRVTDFGSGARATDLSVKCERCGAKATLATAFGKAAQRTMPMCRGRHPHLGLASEPCTEQLRALVVGASNLWFSSSTSVLSLPGGGAPLDQLLYDHRAELQKIIGKDVLDYALSTNHTLRTAFDGHDIDDIWKAIEAKGESGGNGGGGGGGDGGGGGGGDVLGPEWDALVTGAPDRKSPHFEAEPIAAPREFARWLAGVTLAHRLRVVTALCGFTRINAGEPGDPGVIAPLVASKKPNWVPVVENHGEGIFIRLNEAAVQAWEIKAYENERSERLCQAHRDWRKARGLDPDAGLPSERFVLLHSLAHALINEFAIECGYSSASIRERIYSRGPGEGSEPMAGILLYTSAPGAEGTLGGLVNLGKPDALGPLLTRTLERAGLCSSDPLCSDHEPDPLNGTLHGATCHACLLVSETSCEHGNRYLDRATLVDTFAHNDLEFFSERAG